MPSLDILLWFTPVFPALYFLFLVLSQLSSQLWKIHLVWDRNWNFPIIWAYWYLLLMFTTLWSRWQSAGLQYLESSCLFSWEVRSRTRYSLYSGIPSSLSWHFWYRESVFEKLFGDVKGYLCLLRSFLSLFITKMYGWCTYQVDFKKAILKHLGKYRFCGNSYRSSSMYHVIDQRDRVL